MEEQEALDQQREFQERQRSGLGATDTPKILGLSRYGTALTVYRDKVEGRPDGGHGLPAWLGMQLQSTVAELYRTATGSRVRADMKHHRHPQHEWLVCHLDYRVWGDAKTLVECKTRAYMRGWGEDGSTDIPPDVWAQVQHEMLVTGATMTHVAVLFGHHTFRVYPIPRNLVFHTALVEKLQTFWFEHVIKESPPEPSGHELDTAYLQGTHHDDGTVISATPEQAALVRELAERIGYMKDATEAVEQTKNRIKAILGDAVGLQSPYGTITWKTTAERKYVEWKKVAEDLAEALDSEYKDNVLAEASYEHTITKPGVPRFLFEGLAGDMEV